MAVKIVECIPNFSEARRAEVIDQIIDAIKTVQGIQLLDRHSDADHNRTVLTFIGDPQAVEQAAYNGIAKAAELIDLNFHKGEHPRIGATDVVPFVPIKGVTMQECVEISRRLGKRVAETLNIPVYLYEDAAFRTDRKNLEDIRKGEYEGLKEAILHDPARIPDFGPKVLGPAGATVIGAREALIAYNIYLTSSDVEIAEKIARRVRNSSGGFHFVKAMGVLVNGMAQVSMNLTNYHRSPVAQVTEMVRREAQRYGVGIHHSEIVGLTPTQALINASRWYLQLDDFDPDQLLDSKISALETVETSNVNGKVRNFIEEVAQGTPTPGGGSAAAHTGALAAALAVMVARLTMGKPKYAAVESRVWEIIEIGERLRKQLLKAVDLDSQAFEEIILARKRPKETLEEQTVRTETIRKATLHAATIPLDVAKDCLEVLNLAIEMAEIGNLNAISDAGAGANMAFAALKSALLNVRINLIGIEMESEPSFLLKEAESIEENAEKKLVDLELLLKQRAGL